MTVAPLLSDEQIEKLWYEPMPSGHSPSMYDLARRFIAAAQSHFDRTLAELDAEIEQLKEKLDDEAKEHDEVVSSLQDAIWANRERAEAAEARAAEAEKDAGRLKVICKNFDWLGDFDIHEEAAIIADRNGREEPSDDDYLDAVRSAIDALRAEGSGNG